MELPQKIKNKTTIQSINSTSGYFSKEKETLTGKYICTPMFIAALFTIARSWKQPKCPSTDEWIKMMWHIYTMEYYSVIKRNEIELFVVMDEPRVCHTE